MNVPLLDPEGPVQVPPEAGLPPSDPKRLNEGAFEQRVTEALVPAFGAAFTATVTVAVALAQGGTPATV
jgi:hypothetical protein